MSSGKKTHFIHTINSEGLLLSVNIRKRSFDPKQASEAGLVIQIVNCAFAQVLGVCVFPSWGSKGQTGKGRQWR